MSRRVRSPWWIIGGLLVAACSRAAAKSDGRDASPESPTSDPRPLQSAVPAAPEGGVGPPVVAAAHPEALPKLEVQEVAPTGLLPKGAFLSNDQRTLYVTNFGELRPKNNVSIYDAETLEPRGQMDLPHVVVEGAVSPDDKTLYLSSFWGHSVIFVDVLTKTITHEVKTGNHPKIVVVSRDGKSVFAANWSGESITQIDVPTASVVRTLKVGKNPRGLTVTSKGVVYAANFYDESIDAFEGENLDQRHRIRVCKCPRHLALSPDEKTLYISCLFKSEVHALDLSSETVTHHAMVGSAPKSLSVSPDGRYIYTADYGQTRSISVVDTRDWKSKTLVVPGMDRGSGVAVAADGEHAYVTGWYDSHVYKIGFEGRGGHPEDAMKKITNGWLGRPFSRDPGDGQ